MFNHNAALYKEPIVILHGLMSWIMLLLMMGVYALAGLYHHYIKCDNVLTGMLLSQPKK